jgi:hypothetical protein
MLTFCLRGSSSQRYHHLRGRDTLLVRCEAILNALQTMPCYLWLRCSFELTRRQRSGEEVTVDGVADIRLLKGNGDSKDWSKC